jgi:hypothetical protein
MARSQTRVQARSMHYVCTCRRTFNLQSKGHMCASKATIGKCARVGLGVELVGQMPTQQENGHSESIQDIRRANKQGNFAVIHLHTLLQHLHHAGVTACPS